MSSNRRETLLGRLEEVLFLARIKYPCSGSLPVQSGLALGVRGPWQEALRSLPVYIGSPLASL